MPSLPTLKNGLELRRAALPAVFTGFTAFACALMLSLSILITMPATNEALSISNWINSTQGIFEHFQWVEIVSLHRLHLICALVISMVAGVFAGYDAWDHAPFVEPFVTPNPADPRMYHDEDARLKLQARFTTEAGRRRKRGIWLAPSLNLPFALETRNLLVVGASGHGKSNLIRSYAQQMMRRGDKVLLHCNKGDVTQSFDLAEVILISPAHRDGWAWDIAIDIDGPAAAAEFAKDVVPASDQPFWSDSARLVLTDTIIALAREQGSEWGPGDLLMMLLGKPQELQDRIAKIDLSASPILGSGDEDGDKTVQGIMSTLLSAGPDMSQKSARKVGK